MRIAQTKPVGAAALAIALCRQLDTIAKRPDAGQFMRDIKNAVQTIDSRINRPIPNRFCGPCPTLDANGNHCSTTDNRGKQQRTALLAPREATEITCHNCKTLHNIAEIENQLWSEVGEWLLTPSEILKVMEHFGEPVPEATFRRWRKTRKLLPRGERDGEPRYWPADVRTLRNRKAKP